MKLLTHSKNKELKMNLPHIQRSTRRHCIHCSAGWGTGSPSLADMEERDFHVNQCIRDRLAHKGIPELEIFSRKMIFIYALARKVYCADDSPVRQ